MSKYLKGFVNKLGGASKNNEETPTSSQTPQEKKVSNDPLDRVIRISTQILNYFAIFYYF